MTKLKLRFINEYTEIRSKGTVPELIVVAVVLPTGALEVISNTQNTTDKANYYIHEYDDEFRLKKNPDVRIINFMMV